MRTLADMTEEEQQACVGMWATIGGELRIIGQIFRPKVPFCGVVKPDDWGLPTTADLNKVTPRPDLMRAWNPDGTPVVMSQEVDYRLIPAEKNGGKYGHRKWVRYVTEWQPDE